MKPRSDLLSDRLAQVVERLGFLEAAAGAFGDAIDDDLSASIDEIGVLLDELGDFVLECQGQAEEMERSARTTKGRKVE